jgi:hypothetical protein
VTAPMRRWRELGAKATILNTIHRLLTPNRRLPLANAIVQCSARGAFAAEAQVVGWTRLTSRNVATKRRSLIRASLSSPPLVSPSVSQRGSVRIMLGCPPANIGDSRQTAVGRVSPVETGTVRGERGNAFRAMERN